MIKTGHNRYQATISGDQVIIGESGWFGKHYPIAKCSKEYLQSFLKNNHGKNAIKDLALSIINSRYSINRRYWELV